MENTVVLHVKAQAIQLSLIAIAGMKRAAAIFRTQIPQIRKILWMLV